MKYFIVLILTVCASSMIANRAIGQERRENQTPVTGLKGNGVAQAGQQLSATVPTAVKLHVEGTVNGVTQVTKEPVTWPGLHTSSVPANVEGPALQAVHYENGVPNKASARTIARGKLVPANTHISPQVSHTITSESNPPDQK